VKGSGWDMGGIEPAGLPAVRLAPLLRLRSLASLTDAEMVNVQRGNLLDSTAPNPSVETLLHAFLPHKFIDHTHANAVLAISDQPDGDAICREVYGPRVAIVPYIMPGFALAKAAAEVHEAHPDAEGLVLQKHGIFTFGMSAREAYERMIALVTLVEKRLERGKNHKFTVAALPKSIATAAEIAPILRGLSALPVKPEDGAYSRFIMTYRNGAEVLNYVNGAELARYSQQGVVTPDHAIRTKPKPIVLPVPAAGDLDRFAAAARIAFNTYKADYHAYFERNNAISDVKRKELDGVPR